MSASSRAYTAVREALDAGVLKRPETCERCGATGCRIRAHHNKGYDEPHYLSVEWLCSRCHGLEHANNPDAPRRPQVRAPLSLHFRIWDSPLAAFVLEQAHRNRRPLTVELVVLVEEGRDHRNRCASAASKRPEI